MAITSLSNTVLQPTKPKNASLDVSNPGTGAYVSLLNVTVGKGILSRVIAAFISSNYLQNGFVFIRITVDGGTPEVFNGSFANLAWLKGAPQGVYSTSGSNLTPNPAFNLYFESPVYFYKSLLVEIATSSSNAGNIQANCDYSLV